MKRLLLFLGILLMCVGGYGQTTVFLETIGSVSSTKTIASHESSNGFDNDFYTMSGTGDIRNTTASSGYISASGNANVFFTNTVGYYFQIEGINTIGYSNLKLTFGHYKSTVASSNELTVSVSSDGITWTNLTYSRPTGAGTSTWLLVAPSGTIPATSNLRIRFIQTSASAQFRIDDILLQDTIFEEGCNTDIEIESILINSCGGSTEGENEMFRFFTDNSIDTSDIEVDWPSNSWLNICQNSTTANIVSSINLTITEGGELIEPISGIIPPNSQVMFFTSTDFDYTLFDFSDLNYNLYVIFQCPGNTNGHFVNEDNDPGNGCGRTLILTINGCDADTVTYDACILDNIDGEAVDFEANGTAAYGNTGGCFAPIFELPIELLYFHTTCINNEVVLSWATVTETNNNFFTLLKSYDAVNFEQIALINGAGNSNSLTEYNYSYHESSDVVYYKLKQTDFDGNYSYSDIIALNCFDKNKEYKIIPNPAKNGMFIVSGTTEEDIISIFDVMGRKCEKTILDKGCYSVFVNKAYVGKLIVN